MSMLNKKGNVFTLLGIQEDTEERGQQGEYYNCAEEIGLLERKKGE